MVSPLALWGCTAVSRAVKSTGLDQVVVKTGFHGFVAVLPGLQPVRAMIRCLGRWLLADGKRQASWPFILGIPMSSTMTGPEIGSTPDGLQTPS
jgi:hypothetical protein